MKQYKKVELVAKNQVAGSYAAGCPSRDRGNCAFAFYKMRCTDCERAN